MDRNEAMRKIASLMRLAQSENAAEAATAAAHAQALMARAGIDEAALAMESDKPQDQGPMLDSGALGAPLDAPGGRPPRWRGVLAVHVSRMNGTHAYRGADGALHLIGRAGAMEATRYMFAWLAGETQRLTEAKGRGLGVTWRNNFALGVVDTLATRMRESQSIAEEAAKADARAEDGARDLFTEAARETALVRVERAIVAVRAEAQEAAQWGRTHLRLRAGRASYARGNDGARAQGREAGKGIAMGARGAIGGGQRQIGGGR